jgi:hypothetical protein
LQKFSQTQFILHKKTATLNTLHQHFTEASAKLLLNGLSAANFANSSQNNPTEITQTFILSAALV